MIKFRKCNVCGISKSFDSFAINKGSLEGRLRKCKTCHSNEWREYNKEVMRVHDLVHPWENHFRCARARCNCKTHKSFKYYGALGIKMNLTREDFKSLWIRDKAYKMERPSINRIDSCDDYRVNNCEFIELRENCLESLSRRYSK